MSAGRGIESRRTPRRAFVRSIGVLRHGEFGLSQGLQLSEGGLLFSSGVVMTEKERILVTLLLPGSSSIVARAEIIYKIKERGTGAVQYGAKFSGLELHQRRAIRNYVTAKTQEEAEAEVNSEGDTESESETGIFQPLWRPRISS